MFFNWGVIRPPGHSKGPTGKIESVQESGKDFRVNGLEGNRREKGQGGRKLRKSGLYYKATEITKLGKEKVSFLRVVGGGILSKGGCYLELQSSQAVIMDQHVVSSVAVHILGCSTLHL